MAPSPTDPMLKKKRMDFVSQLDKSIFALIIFSYFLHPSMFILISRGITQTQISRPHESHPTSSLRTLTTLLVSNFIITTLYLIMFGPNGSEKEVKGVFLDFVGQATPTSPLHLHTLSILLLILQALCLLVAFESTPFLKLLPSPSPSPPTATTVPSPLTTTSTSPAATTPLRPTPLGPPPLPSSLPPPSPPTPEDDEPPDEEEDFLSLFLPSHSHSRTRTRTRSLPRTEEEGLGLLDDEVEGEGDDWGEDAEEEEEEGSNSIMVLRGGATLGRLMGFEWGLRGRDK